MPTHDHDVEHDGSAVVPAGSIVFDIKLFVLVCGFLATVVIQILGLGWWASQTSERIGYLEKTVEKEEDIGDRITRIETILEVKLGQMSNDLRELESKVDDLRP